MRRLAFIFPASFHKMLKMKGGAGMRCFVLITTFLLILSLNITESNYIADGNILYVGGSGEGNYSSITDAVFAAEDGDTIFVYNGTYEESVYISKRITIIGENAENTIIEAGIYGFGINVSCDGVTIKNFGIKNASWDKAGIILYECNDCTIQNCRIYGNDGNAIELKNANGNVIKNCKIYENMAGIELRESNQNEILDCEIYKNGVAVEVGAGSKNVLHECIISNNSWGGVAITGAMHNKIYDCSFDGNGIMISGSTLEDFIQDISNNSIDGKPIVYIKNESFVLNGTYGEIIAVGCNGFNIKNCSIVGRDVAIEIAYCSNGVIKNCSIHGYYGLLAYNSTGNIIEGNEIVGSNESGIELRGCNGNVIRKNRITGVFGNAISLTSSCDNSICKNDVSQNGMGILIFSYSCHNNISCNHVYDNQFYGISIQGGSYNTVEGNHIHGNKMWCGIAIVKSWTKYNVIRKNNISDNKCGVHLEGIGNLIERNDICRNEYGIYLSAWLSKCKRNVITKNNFIENERDASFEVDVFSLNKWNGNYWEGWNMAAPKPIYGYAVIEFGRFGIKLPWINFDLHPALHPYKN